MPVGSAPPEPIAILTQASGAHLDDQPASAGLSVFEGERLQTDAGGRAALRFGQSSLALIGSSEAALVRVSNGVHVDLSSGAVRFSANELQMVEVHAEDATIGSQIGRATDATVGILQPKVLQIDARRGDLSFTYRQEFRVLPEGQVYRIYLDTPDRSETGASIGVQVGAGSKVAYYILGAGAAGAGISWMTYGAIHSGNQPISPAKP
ncbi:MAG TPA: hypothetical protein VMT75_09770 [Candidatus Saccharimonadales bacterium]|nr:hypothetical protein [Candidatus Saccharimonadales bacterium]